MAEVALEHVKRLVDDLSFDEKLTLIEHLSKQLRESSKIAPATNVSKRQDLYGIWRGCFPEDFDLDAALDEIRNEWEKEGPQQDNK